MLGLHHSTACKAEELTVTIQPGLHHTAIWSDIFWPVNPFFGLFHFFLFLFFLFFPAHTSHHILRHALAVGNHPGERKKSQEESEKEKKDVCDHNRRESNPQSIDWKSLHIPLHHMGHTHTHTHIRAHTHTHTCTKSHTLTMGRVPVPCLVLAPDNRR